MINLQEDEVASAEVYDKLQRVLREAENSEREAYNERCRRRKAEVEVGHAVRLVRLFLFP